MTNAPHGWAWSTLGDVADVLDSRRIPVNAAERATRRGPVPYYGATGQVGWIDAALFDEELVLLGEDGAPFLDPSKPKAYLIDGPSWVNNHAHVLRAGSATTNRFLRYQLDATDYRKHVNGTTRLKLTQGAMREIPFVVPPLTEQERIVMALEEHLSRLEAAGLNLRDAIRRATKLSLQIIESAMHGLGVDAPLERFAIDGGITDGPFGSKLKSSHYTSSGPRVIRLENVGHGAFIDEQTHISESYFDELRKHEALAGDLLVASLVSDRLRACPVPEGLGPAIVKADCIRVRPRADVDVRFLNYALLRPSLGDFVSESVSGVGRTRLGLTNVRRIPVPDAPHAIQRSVADRLDELLSTLRRATAAAAHGLGRIPQLRRTILEQAFSGGLTSQNPDDEPASTLLDRSRAERAATTPQKRRQRVKAH